jgi:hypothetical protein
VLGRGEVDGLEECGGGVVDGLEECGGGVMRRCRDE